MRTKLKHTSYKDFLKYGPGLLDINCKGPDKERKGEPHTHGSNAFVCYDYYRDGTIYVYENEIKTNGAGESEPGR